LRSIKSKVHCEFGGSGACKCGGIGLELFIGKFKISRR
jgi:hypothetical protein